MKKIYSLDKGWKFIKNEHLEDNTISDYFDMFTNISKTGIAGGAKGENLYDGNWETVDIPHDWMVEEKPLNGGIRSQGYRRSGKAWYRKHFTLNENIKGKRIFLRFDAISIHSVIYVNAVKVAEESSGSMEIFTEITDFVEEGRQICLSVAADNYAREGWWYEGGGIFGHAYLIITDESRIVHNSIHVIPEKNGRSWSLKVSAEFETYRTLNAVCEVPGLGLKAKCDAKELTGFEFAGIIPELWSPENPKLYNITLKLCENDIVIDEETVNVGFRECIFSSTEGFFLNGINRKIKGVCLHNDHAGVGIALTDGLMEYRLRKLKEMGCNAIRTSHNPYVPEFYDLCDKMGFLVMDEARHFSSTEECLLQLEKFVKRDRNHPSVIMWSIFNEEPLQCTVRGRNIANRMISLVKALDGTRPVTGGMNGPMEPEGVANVVDIIGFNYMQYQYDMFHNMHPGLPMVGSETGSYLTSRGEALTDMEKDKRSAYKRLMNENLYPWSETPGKSWENIVARRFVMGGFYWTGFDYRGECGEYPSNVSSFGAMDLCGFPKDNFFWHKVLWNDEPQLYFSPYRKDMEEIVCYSNCEEIKLYINDSLIKEYANNKYAPEIIEITYGGTLKAEGYNGGVKVCERKVSEFGKAERLAAAVYTSRDTVIVDYCAYDKDGNFVADADDLIRFEVSGGRIAGVGNGNTASLEPDKDNKRSMYNGCCQLVIVPEDSMITVKASSDAIIENVIKAKVKDYEEDNAIVGERCKIPISDWRMTDPLKEYPKDNIADLIFAWIPTTVGYGRNLMYSGQKGYGMIAGTFTAPREEAVLVIEKIEGSFDLYFGQELLLKKEQGVHNNIEVEISESLRDKNITVTIVFKLQNDNCGITGNIYVV